MAALNAFEVSQVFLEQAYQILYSEDFEADKKI